jgi:hypothetical protein
MGFAVLHIEKGNGGSPTGLQHHIDRTKNVLNADPAKKDQNFYLRAEKGMYAPQEKSTKHPLPLNDRIEARIKEGYTGTKAIRKDAVRHLNVMLTGSHEDMEKINGRLGVYRWAMDNFQFAAKRFGQENIVEFAVHMDERTPHIHCVVVPLTKDGRLSAKEVMGDRVQLSQLQTEYAMAMKQYGMERGIKGSTATHETVKEYYARINERSMKEDLSLSFKVPMKAPQLEKPGVMDMLNIEKWIERQNKVILDTFRVERDKLKDEVNKEVKIALDGQVTRFMKESERGDRLRKENSQLKGIITEKDKQFHPEKYQNEKKIETKKGRGLDI